jgi:uncharacterized protein (TIGR02996 family)
VPTAQDFLDAIIANPDDDTLRLQYADWLDEQGDAARAEFIRVQITLAGMDEADERREGLQKREQDLLDAQRATWLSESAAAFTERVDDPYLMQACQEAGNYLHIKQGAYFARGLLEGIHLAGAEFLKHADALFRMWPIREVRLFANGVPDVDVMSSVAMLACLERLTTFGLCGTRCSTEGIARLLATPHLANLQRLWLITTCPSAAAALAASVITKLESLSIGPVIGAAGAEALAAWPGLAGVTELNLHGNEIGSVGVEFLCSSKYLGRLVSLTLSGNQIEAPGVRAIARTERLAGLKVLRLQNNPLGNRGIEELASSPHLRCLQELDISSADAGSTGARVLARSPILDTLNELNLQCFQLQAAGAVALAQSSRLSSVKTLYLGDNNIGDEGAEALAAAPYLGNVERLYLHGNGLRVFGLKALTKSAHLSALRELFLAYNYLGDSGAQVLAGWQGLTSLKHLDIRGNQITDEGAKALAASPYVERVGRLDLRDNGVSDQGTAEFKAARLFNVLVDSPDSLNQ